MTGTDEEIDDAGDFEMICRDCGAEFTAFEHVTSDGEHIRCPSCGLIDPE